MATRLITIQIHGLKGADHQTQALPPVTFLRGDNAAGKSTILDAVALLVLGYHPTAGRGGTAARTNDAILRLASGDELEVTGLFATGTNPSLRWRFTRRWGWETVTRGKGKGERKTTTSLLAIDPEGHHLAGDSADAALRQFVGHVWALDLGNLLGPDVTDSKRRHLLLDAGGRRSTWTPARIGQELDDRGIIKSLISIPWRGADLDGPLSDWLSGEYLSSKEETSRLRSLVATRREALAGIQEDAQPIEPARVGELRQAHEQMQQQARQIAARTAAVEQADKEAVNRALEAAERARRLSIELDQARRELAAAEAVVDSGALSAELREEIEDLEEGFGPESLPSLQAAVERAEQAIRDAEATAQRAADALRAELADLLEQVRLAELEATAAQEDRRHAEQRKAPVTQELADVQMQLHKAETSTTAAVRTATEPLRQVQAQAIGRRHVVCETLAQTRHLLAEAEEWEEEAHCPTCQQVVGAGVLVHLEQALAAAETAYQQATADLDQAERQEEQRLAAQVTDLRLRFAQVAAAVRTASDALDGATLRELEAAEQARVLRAAHAATQRSLDGAAAESASQLRLLRQAAKRAAEQLTVGQGALATLRQRLVAAEAGTEHTARLATLRERVEGLQTQLRQTLVPDLGALREGLERAKAQGKKERDQADEAAAESYQILTAAEKRLADRQRAADLRVKLDEAEAEFDERRRVEDELGPRGLMGAVIDEILEPLLVSTNACLQGLDLGQITVEMFDSRDNPVCRPGLLRAGAFSPVETLSDGERAAVHAALLVGVANLGAAPWRLLQADALERIDAGRRSAFLRQVVALVASGQADQAILAGCPDTVPVVEGVTVVEIVKAAPHAQQQAA